MKKTIIFAIAVVLSFSLAGCFGKEAQNTDTANKTSAGNELPVVLGENLPEVSKKPSNLAEIEKKDKNYFDQAIEKKDPVFCKKMSDLAAQERCKTRVKEIVDSEKKAAQQ